MRQLVAGAVLGLTLAGCAARTGVTGWRAWTIDPRTSQVVQEETLAPTYEACQACIREGIRQVEEFCRDTSNANCPVALNTMRATQCAPVTVAAPTGPSGMDRFLQVLAILAVARSGHSSAAVLGPVQWNA